jgi:hypothetical protein
MIGARRCRLELCRRRERLRGRIGALLAGAALLVPMLAACESHDDRPAPHQVTSGRSATQRLRFPKPVPLSDGATYDVVFLVVTQDANAPGLAEAHDAVENLGLAAPGRYPEQLTCWKGAPEAFGYAGPGKKPGDDPRTVALPFGSPADARAFAAAWEAMAGQPAAGTLRVQASCVH